MGMNDLRSPGVTTYAPHRLGQRSSGFEPHCGLSQCSPHPSWVATYDSNIVPRGSLATGQCGDVTLNTGEPVRTDYVKDSHRERSSLESI